MKTYQDLERINESERGTFCREAVNQFMMTAEYRKAQDGDRYYNKHNTTIEKYQKFLYTLSGRQVADVFSSNYKLKTLFFRRLVTQQVQYVLGNGVNFENMDNKAKLGKDFDFQLQTVAKKAMSGGRAFGFWNYDHLEVFGFADSPTDAGFCPLYNEETAQLEAGIRYWFRKIDKDVIFRATLYEADGYTDYKQKNSDAVEVMRPKRAYKQIISRNGAGDVESITDENYTKLPIVTLYANDAHESELVGIKECIDCYDFIKSGLANTIDDNADLYWILENTGGMDDVDLAQFVQRMKTVKASVIDGDQGVNVQAHTVDIPVNARQTMLEILRKDIYEDFQALDVNTLSASAKTTQEIQASYQAQDNKCADFEYFLIDFVQQILELAGIDDEPTFKWNRVVNQMEQTQMLIQASSYLTEEVIVKHLPFLTPEEAEDVIKGLDTDSYDRFNDDNEMNDTNVIDENSEE